jgi:hypothetical protein
LSRRRNKVIAPGDHDEKIEGRILRALKAASQLLEIEDSVRRIESD